MTPFGGPRADAEPSFLTLFVHSLNEMVVCRRGTMLAAALAALVVATAVLAQQEQGDHIIFSHKGELHDFQALTMAITRYVHPSATIHVLVDQQGIGSAALERLRDDLGIVGEPFPDVQPYGYRHSTVNQGEFEEWCSGGTWAWSSTCASTASPSLCTKIWTL